MELFGIKIGSEIILANPLLANILVIVLVVSAVKIAFGNEIVSFSLLAWNKFIHRDKNKKLNDWTADCVQRAGWPQKGDAKSINLDGRYLRKLSFIVFPVGNPANWRGGFILGNHKYAPQSIVDQGNAITIHTGSPPPIAKAQHIWIYDDYFGRNNPDSTTVTAVIRNQVNFRIEINKNNFLSVFVNDQQVYFKKVDSSFRKKVYLLAWGDHSDCKVNFTQIRITY